MAKSKAYPYLKALLDASIEAAPNWAKAPAKFVSSLSEQLKDKGEEENKQLADEITNISRDELCEIIKEYGCTQQQDIEFIVEQVNSIPGILNKINLRLDTVDEKLESTLKNTEKTVQLLRELGRSAEYRELADRIKELEVDLEDIPLSKPERRKEKSEKLKKAKQQLTEFKEDVLRLAEIFTKIDINTERLRSAKGHFEKGLFKEADDILKTEELANDQDRLLEAREQRLKEIESVESQLKDNANEFLIKARLTALRFDYTNRFKITCQYFRQAIKSSRTPEILFEFALFLHGHNQFSEALPLYLEVLLHYQRLVKENPESYDPYVAATLNNLGLLYSDQNDFIAAMDAYKRALEIRERLAKENPETYDPDVAMTLNNLAVLYSDQNDFTAAMDAYKRALEIREQLAKGNPQCFELDLSNTLLAYGLCKLQNGDIETGTTQIVRAGQIAKEYKDVPRAQQFVEIANQLLNQICEENGD